MHTRGLRRPPPPRPPSPFLLVLIVPGRATSRMVPLLRISTSTTEVASYGAAVGKGRSTAPEAQREQMVGLSCPRD